MNKVSDELSKKELLDLCELMGIKTVKKDTKVSLVEKINSAVDAMSEVEKAPAKPERVMHSTGEKLDDVRRVGFKGYHPVTGEPV